jgi:hypothetical protein
MATPDREATPADPPLRPKQAGPDSFVKNPGGDLRKSSPDVALLLEADSRNDWLKANGR